MDPTQDEVQSAPTECHLNSRKSKLLLHSILAAKGTGPWADQQQEVQCDNHDMDAEGDDRKQRFWMASLELKAQKE